ncbi:V-type ATP synthase subunit F [Sedimentibacter sp. MB31-C6]|uniref:V-type ATP synthase subunit F n=1 Tax=Sedimentibacter sp. MB31-C6 TaxID=3109366 RepID=UPI002DDD9D16|nr:V-type ATP synthase subunit F [Sedimentibacter sp. MB36-C1]WSI04121.1 V-type ATP synthase subunit F [Sedimentibacter sp. MB36-C1]
MKSFLICDSRDTWVGLRLAGIDGVIVHDRANALSTMKKVLQNREIGILILTEKIADMISEEVMEYKIKSKVPLIIEIPDRHGSIRTYDAIEKYISDSVGIRI